LHSKTGFDAAQVTWHRPDVFETSASPRGGKPARFKVRRRASRVTRAEPSTAQQIRGIGHT